LALAEATELAGEKRIALLCYEDDAGAATGRSWPSEIRARLKCEVVDL
jgi:hypothetical protein